jgi:Xaa-Pro aminopeptidase
MTYRFILSLLLVGLLNETYLAFPLKSAGDKLANLRVKMAEKIIDAYIIPSEDEHQSEYIAEYDERRKWISEFTGSAGTAVVTMKKAALWTDSRYWLRAEKELDKNFWTLKKSGIDESIDDFLRAELNENSTVGMNAKLFSKSSWESRENAFKDKQISVWSPQIDLIDEIWKDRPAKPNSTIFIHAVEYSGKSWQDKMKDVLERMKNVADIFVITALDEVACM